MQANPAEWTAVRVAYLKGEIRNLYWYIRTSERGRQDAYRRRYYRQIARRKDELLSLGESKRSVLDLLACCRARLCYGCAHCGGRGKRANWGT